MKVYLLLCFFTIVIMCSVQTRSLEQENDQLKNIGREEAPRELIKKKYSYLLNNPVNVGRKRNSNLSNLRYSNLLSPNIGRNRNSNDKLPNNLKEGTASSEVSNQHIRGENPSYYNRIRTNLANPSKYSGDDLNAVVEKYLKNYESDVMSPALVENNNGNPRGYGGEVVASRAAASRSQGINVTPMTEGKFGPYFGGFSARVGAPPSGATETPKPENRFGPYPRSGVGGGASAGVGGGASGGIGGGLSGGIGFNAGIGASLGAAAGAYGQAHGYGGGYGGYGNPGAYPGQG